MTYIVRKRSGVLDFRCTNKFGKDSRIGRNYL